MTHPGPAPTTSVPGRLRTDVVRGVPLALLLPVVYFVLLPTGLMRSDAGLLVPAAVPLVVALVVALVSRRRPRPYGLLLGALLAELVLTAIVVAAIGGVADLISG